MSRKYSVLDFHEAPGHPLLSYAESGENLVIKYCNVHITTTWQAVDNVIDAQNKICGKIKGPNRAAVKRAIKAIAGQTASQNNINMISSFVDLVMKGAIERGACNELCNN